MNVRPNATLKRSSFHVQPPCQGSKSLTVSVLTKHSSFGVDVVPVSLAAVKLVGETDLGCPWAIGKLLQHVTPSSHGGSDKGCGKAYTDIVPGEIARCFCCFIPVFAEVLRHVKKNTILHFVVVKNARFCWFIYKFCYIFTSPKL